MSNKTRLQTNNTNLQALIDKANALPDAGSSGGGEINVDTCTLKFIGAGPCNIVYMTSDDTGVHTQVSLSTVVHNELIVVCDSYIGVVGDSSNALGGTPILNGAELIKRQAYGAIFKITAPSGENASIMVPEEV